MPHSLLAKTSWLVSIAALAAVPFLPAAPQDLLDPKDIDLNDLIDDTQRMSPEPDLMTFVWWLPIEFWEASMASEPGTTQADIDEMVEVLDDYIMVSVVDGTIGVFGGVTYVSEADIRKHLRIVDERGKSYTALDTSKVNADAKSLVAALRPVMANMIGPLGENMNFYFFPAKDAKGRAIADAATNGHFTVKTEKESYKFRLPLGSLLRKKLCPTDDELLSGAWSYCPWHGDELKSMKTQ